MVPLTSLLAAASLVGLAVAAPSPKIGVTARTTLHQQRNPNYVFSGPVALYKAYRKFGSSIPADLQAAVERTGFLSKRSEGDVVASPTNAFDVSYTIPVSIGSPPQVLQLDLDTGSSDLWVFSSQTESNEVNGQTLYYPSQSRTSNLLNGYSWQIEYGDDSSSSGDVYTDIVTIGGVTVTSQAVEAAEQVSTEFTSDSTTDGLLGLGFDNINTVTPVAQLTFFSNAESQLDAALFTADLKHDAPGSYDFGFINSSLYTGEIAYAPVTSSNGFWEWTSTGYAVGSGAFKTTNNAGIADTGTTLLLLSTAVVKDYYKHVKGSSNSKTYGGYVFPCSTTLPSFTFGVGSASITIPGSYMNAGPAEDGSSTCFGGLQVSPPSAGVDIYGDVALKSAFVVFDNSGDSPQVGWAAKNL